MRRPSHGVRPISNATTFAIVIVGAPYGEGDMPDARYFVERLKAHSDAWMIKFEAVLFAIEAAEKRNEHGEKAQIVIIGPTWAHDQDISRGSW
jgi:hypothetical protein